MRQFEIRENEAGQRFDKYLHKLLPKAPSSFFYKMLRKKNITLNGKRAEGKEKLSLGDKVSLFLSDETIDGFRGTCKSDEYADAYDKLDDVCILFENDYLALVHKPAGVLSQKAKADDVSVNEWFIGYMLSKNQITIDGLQTYKPGVCNRLDRNTSGIVICAKTLTASQELSKLIAERRIRKFYRLFVKGEMKEAGYIDGYLVKDRENNKVRIIQEKDCKKIILTPDEKASYIETKYEPLQKLSDMTYLEVELVTGKTHQIRAHMASLGHPLLGDYKYGDKAFNYYFQKKYGVKSQLLHAYRLEFERNELLFNGNSFSITDKEPEIFYQLLEMN